MPLVVGGALLVSGLAAVGPFAVPILYDPRYRDAGWIVQILAAMSWFQILENTNGSALLATGRSDWMAAGNGVKLAGMIAFIPAGFLVGGFAGALAGLVVAEALRYLVSAIGIRRRGLRVLALDTGFTLAVAVVAAAGYLAGIPRVDLDGEPGCRLHRAASPCVAIWGIVGLRYWSRRPAIAARRRSSSAVTLRRAPPPAEREPSGGDRIVPCRLRAPAPSPPGPDTHSPSYFLGSEGTYLRSSTTLQGPARSFVPDSRAALVA